MLEYAFNLETWPVLAFIVVIAAIVWRSRPAAHRTLRNTLCFLAFGAMVAPGLEVAARMDATLVNMRFVKPLDLEMVQRMAENHDLVVTLEENAVAGGAGAAVNEALADIDLRPSVLNIGLPDTFIEHGSREECLADAGLDADSIHARINERLQKLGKSLLPRDSAACQ